MCQPPEDSLDSLPDCWTQTTRIRGMGTEGRVKGKHIKLKAIYAIYPMHFRGCVGGVLF